MSEQENTTTPLTEEQIDAREARFLEVWLTKETLNEIVEELKEVFKLNNNGNTRKSVRSAIESKYKAYNKEGYGLPERKWVGGNAGKKATILDKDTVKAIYQKLGVKQADIKKNQEAWTKSEEERIQKIAEREAAKEAAKEAEKETKQEVEPATTKADDDLDF